MASKYSTKQTIKTGKQLREEDEARAAVLQKARKEGTYNPGYTGDVSDSYAYLQFGEKDYTNYASDKKNRVQYQTAVDSLSQERANREEILRQLGNARRYSGEQGDVLKYNPETGKMESTGEKWSDAWTQLAGELEGTHKFLNRQEYQTYLEEANALKEEEKTLDQNRKNNQRASMYGVQSPDALLRTKEANDAWIDNRNRQKELSAKMAELDDEMFNVYASDEVKAARQALTENMYGDASFMGADGTWIQNGNGRSKEADQKLVDDFMTSIGGQTQYYNFGDRLSGGIVSGAQGIGGSIVGFLGTFGKAAGQAGEEQARQAMADQSVWERTTDEDGNTIISNTAERNANAYDEAVAAAIERQGRETIGGFVVPTSDEINSLKQQANAESFNGTANLPNSATEELQKSADAWVRKADELDKQAADARAQVDAFRKSAVGAGEVNVGEFAELQKQAKELERQAKDARSIASQYGGGRASLDYALRHGNSDDIYHTIDQISWDLGDKANEELRKATQNAKPIEKMLVHMTKTGVEMGFDAAVGAATGVGGLPVMFTRVFGQASQEANRAGVSLPKQIAYGATVAGIEVLTEKFADFAGGAIYGKSFTQDVSKNLIRKLTDSEVWRKVLQAGADVLGEGLEEGMSDIMGGLAEMIIRRNPDKGFWEDLKDLTAEQCADIWYDMLLGSMMGLIGVPGGFVNGNYAEGNREMRIADTVDNVKAVNDYDSKYQSRVNELSKYEGMTQSEAEKQTTAEMGARPQESAGNTAQQKIAAIEQLFGALEQLSPEKIAEFRDSLPDEVRLTREEFDAAVQMGILDEEDAPNYLVKGETAETGEATEEPSGEGTQSRLKGKDKVRKTDEEGNPLTRMRKITDRMARVAERLGYGNKSNSDEAFKTATGMTPEELEAKNNAESKAAMEEAGDKPVKGGDAAHYNLNNYNEAGLNKLWKDHELTSGQYAEAMVRRGFWSEKMARSFLSTARQNGASPEERKRNLGNFTIGENINENAPESQPASEGSPAPAETAEEVKPAAESKSEQTSEPVSIDGNKVVAGIVKQVSEEIDEDIRAAKARGNKRFNSEWKRQNSTFSYIEDAYRNGELTADETFAAMKQYAPDVLELYGYESGADMVEKNTAAAAKNEADLKADVEKLRNRKPMTLDEIIKKAWSEAKEKAAFNKEAFGRGSGEAGWNYFVNSVRSMRQNAEITTEEANAAITKVTGGWGDWALFTAPSRAEQVLAAQQESGIIDTKKEGINNDFAKSIRGNQKENGAASRGGNAIERGDKQASGGVEIGAVKETHYEPPNFQAGTPEAVKDTHKAQVADFESRYHAQIPRAMWPDSAIELEKWLQKHGTSHLTLFNGLVGKGSLGVSLSTEERRLAGIFVSCDKYLTAGPTAFHENGHDRYAEKYGMFRKNSPAFDMASKLTGSQDADVSAVSSTIGNVIFDRYFASYMPEIAGNGKADVISQLNSDLTLDEKIEWVKNNFSSEESTYFFALYAEEVMNNLVSKDTYDFSDGDTNAFNKAVQEARRLSAKEGLYDADEFAEMDRLSENFSKEMGDICSVSENTKTGFTEILFNGQLIGLVFNGNEGNQNTSTTDTAKLPKSAEGSGTVKESQSAALRQQATRGEENAVRGEGTTYVSKTNEERSRIADHLLEDGKSMDETIDRLLNKDERWDDQDVVTAERAMYKMIRAIRDYQLGNKHRMKKSGFDALTRRYNKLAERHIQEKSKAGQELQATYQFTPAEQIMSRMAKTFLGFTKDGIFAGEAPLAVNAKIYAAAEDAANRIGEAVEKKDAKALAQICKDISDIRGVKHAFGVAAEFASKVENEILDAIAKQENGVEALETLAYGNLNAIADDVQPYKVVNAAKTIRVMNMLSNMSTIINNITNNIASGLTSTNALAQGSSMLASKAFENIIGQPVLTPAAKGWVANKEIRNAEMEALKMATLVQMYGVNQENGRLELSGDKGLFNPNANAFEQTMAMYKFFIGMGVEATDQVKSAGLQKAMNIGIDKALAKGKITEQQAEQMRKEAKHEVDRLLYKDDNRLSGFVQGVRNRLNKAVHWGNDDIGTIGLGDITMAFAKVPANVVRARLYATPEGCLLQLAQYTKGVMKAKRMHSEAMARGIMDSHAAERANLQKQLDEAYELDANVVGKDEKEARINKIKAKQAALDRACWTEAREKCSGSVYNKLIKLRDNYSSNLNFDDAVRRAGYSDATEMSQFEAATYSRKIGKAATSAGMVALGAILRGLGALRDFDQEPDDELRKMYKQKGYSGLMFNWSALGRKDHEWKDGDIIVDADFLEVIAMPLAIGATAREAAMNVEGNGKAKAFVTEAGTSGLSKTFEAVGDIPGMTDAVNLYNAITSQFNTDNAAKGSRVFNAGVEYLANTLPSFFIPNAYTQLGAGLDNTVRDVYATDNIWQQAGNIALNKTAFFRKKIPASVDMWGEEKKYGENTLMGIINKSLLPGDVTVYHQNKYEQEILRLTKAGYKGAVPKLSVSGSFEVDGETYELTADEKREFRVNRNKEQAEVYKALMDSPEYQLLDDAQKVAVLKNLKMDCERDAKQAVLIGRGSDVEVTRAKWETELKTTKEQITYLSLKELADAAWDSEENAVGDYAAMDKFIKENYNKLTPEMKDILDNSLSHVDDLADAAKVGINSKMWQTAYDIYRQYNSDEGAAAVEGAYKDWEATEMWTKIEKATGANATQMNWFEDKMALMRHMRVDPEHYQDLTDKLGWNREAASALTKTMSELQPGKGNKTVSYKQRLTAVAQAKGVTEEQKWEAFYEYCPSSYTKIRNGMTAYRKKGYTLEQAMKSYKTKKSGKYNTLWWVD